jgi:hypothetical protein
LFNISGSGGLYVFHGGWENLLWQEGGALFGDFTLKIVGEMTQKKSRVVGQYVFTCGTMKRDKHMAR